MNAKLVQVKAVGKRLLPSYLNSHPFQVFDFGYNHKSTTSNRPSSRIANKQKVLRHGERELCINKHETDEKD